MNHQIYKIEELLKDKTFHNWANQSNQVDVDYWDSYLVANPDQIGLLLHASKMVKGFTGVERKLPIEKVNLNWVELNNKIDKKEQLRIALVKKGVIRLSIAAGILAVLFLTVFYILTISPSPISDSTSEGEHKTVSLPDQTTAVLYPNTQLNFSPFKNQYFLGEIDVKGSADFSLISEKKRRVYKVNSSLILQVYDRRSRFNILDDKSSVQIKLHTGKLKLNIKDEQKFLMLVEGETAVFEKNNYTLFKKNLNFKINSV